MMRWILSLRRLVLFAYLICCIGISGFALGSFAKIIQTYLYVDYDYRIESAIVIGQVFFQWLFMINAAWSDLKKYAVLALTISMFGSLLLLPLVTYSFMFQVSEIVALIYFFCVVAILFITHYWLIKKEQLPTVLTYSWVLYRLLVLSYVAAP
jgi:hypothetical protein